MAQIIRKNEALLFHPPAELRIGRTYRPENDVTLYHGDCLDLLKSMPDGCADLIVTSPPTTSVRNTRSGWT